MEEPGGLQSMGSPHNLHFTDEETEVDGFPRSHPRSYRYKVTLPGSSLAEV